MHTDTHTLVGRTVDSGISGVGVHEFSVGVGRNTNVGGLCL